MKILPRRGSVRTVREPQIVRVRYATFIPSGMNGATTYNQYNHATFIPSGMHQFHNRAAGYMQVAPAYERAVTGLGDATEAPKDVVASLVRKGVHPHRAHGLVVRALARHRHAVRNRYAGVIHRSGISGLGDVVVDATTWITYGNDIVNRSKTGNVGAEAMKAAQNINTFLGNRGDELQASSPSTVDALGQVTDLLTKIASGQVKYDSVAGAFFDEFGNAVRGEVSVGVRAVLDTPKKVVKYLGEEVVKPALDVIPWYLWIAGAAGGAVALSHLMKK